MNHSFDIDTAIQYGVYEAIFIENLRFWVLKNKANNRHFYNGRYWTYNSAKAFAALFPYWSKQQIERIISKLKQEGVLDVGHFSPNTYDRTNWYTLSEELLSSKVKTPFIEIDESSSTYIKPDTFVGQKIDNFEIFWKAYPRKTNKGFAKRVFDKIKPSDDLLKKMLSSIEQQKSLWKDPQYIPHPSTWLNGERWEDEVNAPQAFNPFAGSI